MSFAAIGISNAECTQPKRPLSPKAEIFPPLTKIIKPFPLSFTAALVSLIKVSNSVTNFAASASLSNNCPKVLILSKPACSVLTSAGAVTSIVLAMLFNSSNFLAARLPTIIRSG